MTSSRHHDGLNISPRLVGDVTILDLSGRLCEGGLRLQSAIRKLLGEGKRKILLNMVGVAYINSSGLGPLISSLDDVVRQGGSLKVSELFGKSHEIFKTTKLLDVFDIWDSEEDALKSFGVSPMHSLCPVCHHPSQPPLLDERLPRWLAQTCGNCLSRFNAWFSPHSGEQALVESLCVPTYENEFLQILSGRPFTLQVVGRLDLFASSALGKAWHSLPAPRRVLFDLRQTTEISHAGRDVLLALWASSEEEARAAISVEGLGQEQMRGFPIGPPVYSTRAAALAALGDVSDTPPWFLRTDRSA
jgi:anti-sigma B factor antagonist